MKYDCDMICDLLPLYIDSACSKASSDAVEQHLAECESCTSLYKDMISSEEEIDNEIIKERDQVISSQAKYFKRRSAVAGSIIGGIFALPILICLIVNLATGAGLTWFFIVLTAMFIPASLTVVPLMVPANKGLCTLGAFTASLITLLGVCCIYSGGNWFFVAASAVLFGLTVLFAPFVVRARPVAGLIKGHKGLAVAGAYTVTYLLLMIAIGVSSDSRDYARYALAYSVPALGYLWSLTGILGQRRFKGCLKAAALVLVSTLFWFFGDTIVLLLLGRGLWFPDPAFGKTDMASMEQAACWVVLIIGIIISAVLMIIGIRRSKNKDRT